MFMKWKTTKVVSSDVIGISTVQGQWLAPLAGLLAEQGVKCSDLRWYRRWCLRTALNRGQETNYARGPREITGSGS